MTEQSELTNNEILLRNLLLQSLKGDSCAYQQFLKELARLLRGYFRRRMTAIPDEVEDLVQETLLAIHNKRHTYVASQPVTVWVYAIAKYKLVDLMRQRERRDQWNEPFDDAGEFATESDDEATDARRDVHMLLNRLPDRMRLPIIHTKLDGLSIAEAAERSGMSESAVKVGVHRGLKALQGLLRGTQ